MYPTGRHFGMALAGVLPLILGAIGLSVGWTLLCTIIAVAIYFAVLEIHIWSKRQAARKLPHIENRVGFWSIKRDPD